MAPPGFTRYCYSATVRRVVDGDTVDILLDLGCGVWRRERVRLRGINAPEIRGVADTAPGIAARAHLSSILTMGAEVSVRTYRDREDKYGRLLAEVWTPNTDMSVSDRMMGAGHAVPYLA